MVTAGSAFSSRTRVSSIGSCHPASQIGWTTAPLYQLPPALTNCLPMSASTLQPVRRSRLYEQVVERLRRHIDVEGLRPGDRLLSEREMAERLGVSRTSVRQALTALEVMGLVEIRHGDGVFLTHPPEVVLPPLATALADEHEQLPAVMEVRQAIEAQTARLAARRRTAEDLETLEGALDRMARAIEAGEDPADADSDFHDGIVAAARNPLLAG